MTSHTVGQVSALAVICLTAIFAPGTSDHRDSAARGTSPPQAEQAAGKAATRPTTLSPAVPLEWRLEAPFQGGIHCGPNSLYLLLRLWGLEVSREQVERSVPLASTGCTLEDLRRGAIDLGLNVEIRKVTPDEVKDLPKPLIAHFFAPARAPGAPAQERDHFAVVTRTHPDGGFQSIDSNNLVNTTYSAINFARNFSGYCLIVKPPLASRLMASRAALLAGVLLVLMGTNALLACYLQRRSA